MKPKRFVSARVLDKSYTSVQQSSNPETQNDADDCF